LRATLPPIRFGAVVTTATKPQFREDVIYMFCLFVVSSLDLLQLIKLSSSEAAGFEKNSEDHNRHFTEAKMSSVYQRLRRTTKQKDAIYTDNSFRSGMKCYASHVIEERGEEIMIMIEVKVL
jgi:hypothetical protein